MIFAAYAGTGKSFAAEKLDKVLDMAIVPYKYKFPQEYKMQDFAESDKGCVEYPFDEKYPEKYPEKYVADILRNIREYEHILIPSDNRVMDVLDAQSVEYVLCYPESRLKDEYRKRYHERGNTEAFLRIFVDNWDMWMESFEKRCCKKYVMHEGEFLSDIIERYMLDECERVEVWLPNSCQDRVETAKSLFGILSKDVDFGRVSKIPNQALTEHELLEKLEKSREHAGQGMFRDADEVFRDMRAKYGL